MENDEAGHLLLGYKALELPFQLSTSGERGKWGASRQRMNIRPPCYLSPGKDGVPMRQTDLELGFVPSERGAGKRRRVEPTR